MGSGQDGALKQAFQPSTSLKRKGKRHQKEEIINLCEALSPFSLSSLYLRSQQARLGEDKLPQLLAAQMPCPQTCWRSKVWLEPTEAHPAGQENRSSFVSMTEERICIKSIFTLHLGGKRDCASLCWVGLWPLSRKMANSSNPTL